MRVFAKITDTKTGQSVVADTGDEWDGEYSIVSFDWLENNHSCDCNRCIHFEDAGGETDYDGECGDGRFHVSLIDPDGNILAEDSPRSTSSKAQG